MREKSSKEETLTPFGITMCRGEKYIKNCKGETQEPCGMPTEMGARMLGEPWKTRVHILSKRNKETQSTR